ncbi:MAG: metallophosphatase family protein [Proteobacteria bacterium]|nr:metallophosphatase family protein [Pseudomonadota bacterium]MBU1716425.1 metallophosphatase family protein [Pseudomonadota bacterium]
MSDIKIGVLSDTHLARPDDTFRQQVKACFAKVSIIIHAGDLTDVSILEVFADKEIHAVHGNMCEASAYKALPGRKIIEVGPYRIAITHGAGVGSNIEETLYDYFFPIDCIIYGHTHQPVCHQTGRVLFMNPGSFTRTSRYGAPGTYGILEVGDKLSGAIYEIPRAQ